MAIIGRQLLERPVGPDTSRGPVEVGSGMDGTSAVIVLYRPEPDVVLTQFRALSGHVESIIYVDNGSGRAALGGVADRPDVTVLGDGSNVGLAAALNAGLAMARDQGATHALLLDQDSVPSAGMVDTLRRGLDAADRVVAVGPAILDELTGTVEDFTRLRIGPNARIRPQAAPAEFFDVDFLITSGTLLRLELLDQAGWMDPDLFIDCIDFDWSFRARSRGWRLLATFQTTLSHRRGDSVHRLPGGLPLRIHSATRLYYMHRNRIRLYRRDYVPVAWKVHDVARLMVKAVLLAVFVSRRRERLGAIARGIRDGVRS